MPESPQSKSSVPPESSKENALLKKTFRDVNRETVE